MVTAVSMLVPLAMAAVMPAAETAVILAVPGGERVRNKIN
jgi:hypothetical protein